MDDTTPIASFRTADAADAAAELLRANAIKCAVADPSEPPMDPLYPGMPQGEGHTVVVADQDADRAREALDGFLVAAWFLRARDGRRVHAFETATAERLRRHAATAADPDGWAARDCTRLADLLEAGRAVQVAGLFRHERAVEGRTLAEWAHACGCEPAERAR